ncbi:MAG: stalk domain-containing protein [Bacillota bacterium]|nr:stalk domain-containing protein [Bacillota bacterium]
MKKKLVPILSVLLIFLLGVAVGASDSKKQYIKAVIDNTLKVVINGETFSVKDSDGTEIKPIIYNNRTYLPLRSVSEICNYNIDWDSKSNTIILDSANDTNDTPFKDSKDYNERPTITPGEKRDSGKVTTQTPRPTEIKITPKPTEVKAETTPTEIKNRNETVVVPKEENTVSAAITSALSNYPEFGDLEKHDGNLTSESAVQSIKATAYAYIQNNYSTLPDNITMLISSIKESNGAASIRVLPMNLSIVGYAKKDNEPYIAVVRGTIMVVASDSNKIFGNLGAYNIIFMRKPGETTWSYYSIVKA